MHEYSAGTKGRACIHYIGGRVSSHCTNGASVGDKNTININSFSVVKVKNANVDSTAPRQLPWPGVVRNLGLYICMYPPFFFLTSFTVLELKDQGSHDLNVSFL